MYFAQQIPADYEIIPKPDLRNTPVYVHPEDLDEVPAPGRPLTGKDFERFVARVAEEIAGMLNLQKV